MALFAPPPPSRAGSCRRLLMPGASDASALNVAVQDRQVLDRVGGDGERALAALRLDERRLGGDLDRLGRAADFERERLHATRGRPR